MDIWTEIGKAAGEVYEAFKGKGKVPLNATQKISKSDSTIVLMAIGWLAREGKAEVTKGKTSYEIKILD